MQRRRSTPVHHNLQPVRALPSHADPRARGQGPKRPTQAFIRIPCTNTTDVRTLRASFGSFTKIAMADGRLPVFGLKKVARLKDAFDRPPPLLRHICVCVYFRDSPNLCTLCACEA
ncbi:hypothetical protein EDB85DRAFT_112187 [Lactarius pseudohatsudake]|nr:hypothetical protein EDB85DRAFT_112187 [Lactarius pseudohatsudake]